MVPKDADKVVFEVAPVIIVSTTVMVFAFVPFGPHIYAAQSRPLTPIHDGNLWSGSVGSLLRRLGI